MKTGGSTAAQNELDFFSVAVAVTIVGTDYAYPGRDGQAKLAWVA